MSRHVLSLLRVDLAHHRPPPKLIVNVFDDSGGSHLELL